MVRLGVSVEGVTEERFVSGTLVPYLAKKNVYASAVTMGGSVSLDKIRSELKDIAYSFDYVTTLYDFYGFSRKETGETKSSLENRIFSSVHKSIQYRIIPYIQMYEFEGLLFSSPKILAEAFNDDDVQSWAEEILRDFRDNPEAINDSVETAPSKRLMARVNYKKTIHGPNIASEMGLEKIREMCPGFNEWLERLENLSV